MPLIYTGRIELFKKNPPFFLCNPPPPPPGVCAFAAKMNPFLRGDTEAIAVSWRAQPVLFLSNTPRALLWWGFNSKKTTTDGLSRLYRQAGFVTVMDLEGCLL